MIQFSGGIAQSVTCWAVNPEVPGSIPARALEISEILFVVFPAISDRVDCISIWLKVPGSCVSVLYTGHIKEPGCLFEIRARRTLQRRTCLYLMSLSPFWGLSLSLSLWSDHAVSALVEDAPAPLWLQHTGVTM